MIKIIDLFSGVGGVAQGFKMSQGFDTLLVKLTRLLAKD